MTDHLLFAKARLPNGLAIDDIHFQTSHIAILVTVCFCNARNEEAS